MGEEITISGYMRKLEVAEYLGVTLQTISKLMRKGRMPYHKLSRKLVLFRRRDVDKAMDRLRVGGIADC